MNSAKNIRSGFQKLSEKIRTATEISEEEVRVKFVESGVLEALGYKGILKDIRLERGVKGKRSDLLAFDDYQNVVFVVEFKRPTELDVDRDFAQLWERYVKPLRARYGVLTDGLELLIYERINSNGERIQHVTLGEVTLSECEALYDWLKKPEIKRTRIEEVLGYFEQFDEPAERVNLSTEIAQQHFFASFELKEGSVFVNLVEKTIALFDSELGQSKFLTSAYNFWKVSYAKKPDKIPETWQRIMATIGLEATEEDLFKFMFCLESAYSLFTRLILAKACEDYKLPDIDFSGFIKNQIRTISFRGDIPLPAWSITTKNLIESMRQRLVQSVFEGDIFYWWEDSYREISAGDALYSPKLGKPRALFGEALAEIIFTLYKFDFSEIVGDPLGTLYQRYFDKETRKALGEFYTPLEVVTYILDAVGYEGRSVLGRRLLDPACGSGTFLVEALRRYLKASEQVAEEKGWPEILKELCNEYCIVGFDIHPFATFMAQMQFMLVLIPAYKKAMEEDHHFVLNRLPIFRTDSLIDETKGETRKVTLETFESVQYLLIDTGLPIDGGNLKIKMPYREVVTSKTDLYDVQEYFAALQAVFDMVKEAARKETYVVDTNELERNFKRYLGAKNWSGLVAFFTPYAEHFLQRFKELKETFGDGKLIKSLEDIMLAAVLKNYVQYDFVVGNPPYVRTRKISKEENERFRAEYYTPYGSFDIYLPFMERGIKWLNEAGKFGFITSNKYFIADYGIKLRRFILNNCKISQLVDLSFCPSIFEEPLIYAAITILERRGGEILTDNLVTTPQGKKISVAIGFKNDRVLLKDILARIIEEGYVGEDFRIIKTTQERFATNNDFWFDVYAIGFEDIIKKVKQNAEAMIENFEVQGGFMGFEYHQAEKFIRDAPLSQAEYKKILPPSLISKYGILWGNKTIDIFGKKFDHPYLLFDSEIRDSLWAYFNKSKILVRGIAKEVSAAYDKEGYALLVNVFGITPKNLMKIDLLYLLGVLNSELIDFYHKVFFFLARIPEGSLRYPKPFWEQLPICVPKNLKERNVADQIASKVEQILEEVKLEQKIEHFPDEYIQEFRSKGEEFFSPPITFDSDHKALEPVMEAEISGRSYNILISKKETPIFVDSKVKADYVVAALKGKRAMKDEKPQLLIPKSDTVVESILQELEDDRAKVQSPSVADLEAEINELVYKLYGLNEEDVKVVEDFLRRF